VDFWHWIWFFFIVVPCIMLWVFALFDIFRRHDLHAMARVLWVLLVIVLPLLGTLIYLVARPSDPDFGTYPTGPSESAGAANTADQLKTLGELRANGTLTEQEFAAAKARLLGGAAPA
jgi:hypothetical protein